MSKETKRDVLEDIIDTLHVMDGAPDDYCKKLLNYYDNALPDDIPVIPKVVGEWFADAEYLGLTPQDAGLVEVKS